MYSLNHESISFVSRCPLLVRPSMYVYLSTCATRASLWRKVFLGRKVDQVRRLRRTYERRFLTSLAARTRTRIMGLNQFRLARTKYLHGAVCTTHLKHRASRCGNSSSSYITDCNSSSWLMASRRCWKAAHRYLRAYWSVADEILLKESNSPATRTSMGIRVKLIMTRVRVVKQLTPCVNASDVWHVVYSLKRTSLRSNLLFLLSVNFLSRN